MEQDIRLIPGVWSLGIPAGMSTSCVSAPGIVPGAWWDGRGTPTCCFLRDQMYFPPLLGRQDGFHQPGALRQSVPGEPRDSGHSTFLALRIRCPSDDISTALCRREGGSLPASKPQPVEKPITGKAKLRAAARSPAQARLERRPFPFWWPEVGKAALI